MVPVLTGANKNTLLGSDLLFTVSTLGEKLGYKVLFSRQEAQCQPLVNLFCKMFAQKPLCVCLLKSIKTRFVKNPEHSFWVNFFPPLVTTIEMSLLYEGN